MNQRFIGWPDDTEATSEGEAWRYGGKALALRRLAYSNLPIPPWFVLTPDAYHASVRSVDVPEAVAPSNEVCVALRDALQRLCPEGEPVAVRSSAADEDGAGHSFAGQLESFLWVEPDDVPNRVAAVWCSGFSERIVAYRRERGLSPDPHPPAVLIQRMVRAEATGVGFSADPVSGRRGVSVVAAVWGLGTALVSGEADADTFAVDREGRVTERHVADKRTLHVPAPGTPEGVRSEPVPQEKQKQPVLTDAQAVAVAALARQAAAHFGVPQDIEWAMESGHIYLLQSRPITTLSGRADPDGVLRVWDNSNIAESYNGITTPLTFSFARNAYENVYREFCRLLGVSAERVADSATVFRNMLGLIRGRVYYNLPNWHRALALLPGYRVNRAFMEQMMGVREPLPEEVIGPTSPLTGADRMRDGVALGRAVVRLVQSYRRLPQTIDRFYARLDAALAVPAERVTEMRPDELAAHYRDLETQLLTRWDAPLINDFLCMIFHGLLRRLTAKWVPGQGAEHLHNDLVSGEGGIISAEPAQRVRTMAELASGNSEVVRALCDLPPAAALQKVRSLLPELAQQFDQYLEKFGDRCLEELKLESVTLADDPTPLVRAVGNLAAHGEPGRAADTGAETPRDRAERRVRAALGVHPVRRIVYEWTLANARRRIRDRENLRFERTRVFGRVRRIFVELGRRFVAEGMLDDARDVFYLEAEEALGLVEGTATCTDIRALAAVRKSEFNRYRELLAPADRFETRGMVAASGNDYQGTREADAVSSEGDVRQGLACCPGTVRGPVRVVTDPRGTTLEPGTILVAERTDPGWILLFPAASGLLVERGSLLSHSAIVAREMRIPAIVSVPGVTAWLKDGDFVEMDGSTGSVRRLAWEAV